MKIINEPIKVMAIFSPGGKIEPIKFRLDDEVVKIEKIMKIYEEKKLGKPCVFFVCLHNRCNVYELKYETITGEWYLYKK